MGYKVRLKDHCVNSLNVSELIESKRALTRLSSFKINPPCPNPIPSYVISLEIFQFIYTTHGGRSSMVVQRVGGWSRWFIRVFFNYFKLRF